MQSARVTYYTYKQYYSGSQVLTTQEPNFISCKKAKKFLLLVSNHSKCNSELIGAGIIQGSRASRNVFHYSTGGSGHSAAFTNQSFLLKCSEHNFSTHMLTHKCSCQHTHTHDRSKLYDAHVYAQMHAEKTHREYPAWIQKRPTV